MCICSKFKEFDVIPMGWDDTDKKFFEDLDIDHRVWFWETMWWLSYVQCNSCHTDWLIGQDELIHDNYIIHKITLEEASKIRNNNLWPNDFNHYETLLEFGVESGSIAWLENFNESMARTIQETIEEIKSINPQITDERLTYLFQISLDSLKKYLMYKY